MVFVVFFDGNGLLSRIDDIINGWIRKVWLFSILCKFFNGICIYLRYFVSFICLVGLKIVRMFMFLRDGLEKNRRNCFLLVFFFLMYFCSDVFVCLL